MSRRALTLLIASVLAVGLFVAGWLLPVPYIILSPGLTLDTLGSAPSSSSKLVEISGAPTSSTRGKLIMLTVYLQGGPGQQPTMFSALAAWFNHQDAVLPQQFEFPPGQSSKVIEQQNIQEMQQSQQDAVTAALGQLGLPGIVAVEQTVSPAATRELKVGDVIRTVNGVPVTTAGQLRAQIHRVRAGQPVTLGILRGSKPLSVTLPTQPGSTGPEVDIIPLERPRPPLKVSIDLSATEVGGPSAGMIFALAIVDRLTPGGITGGRSIAGTGTIDFAGNVGPIGGIQQKVFAAVNAGAAVFLAPTSECPSAKAVAPSRLRVIPVSTLAGAVSALKALGSGGAVPSC